jgi:transcriptional regulator with XRE-family HTH domain
MIRTENEYKKALDRLTQDKEHIRAQRAQLETLDLTNDQIERAMQPVLSFHTQLEEEVEAYERLRRGELPTLYSLSSIGRWLIGIRVAKGLGQKELAALLGSSEQQVSRDERNEYHGITVDRAQKILQTMGVHYRIEEDPSSQDPVFEVRRDELATTTTLEERPPRVSSTAMPLPTSVPGQLAMWLRADKNLAPDKAVKLAEMFRLAYESAAETTSST